MPIFIILLGGAIWYGKGKWQTNGLDGPGDKMGITGDRFRVHAAAYLYRDNPEATIIISGGGADASRAKPSVASVIAKELELLGVPRNRMVLEEKGDTTFHQLVKVAKALDHVEGELDIRILSNGYHLPRINEMLQRARSLFFYRQHTVTRSTISAEDILLAVDREKWSPILDRFSRDPRLENRLKIEARGVAQVKEGTYVYQPL